MPPIEAKVARLLNSRELAINAGSDRDVHEGDFVRIYERTPILDPDTKETLGSVITTLASLQVRTVMKRFSVARIISTTNSKRVLTEDPNLLAFDASYVLVEPGRAVLVEKPVAEPPPDDTDIDDLPF